MEEQQEREPLRDVLAKSLYAHAVQQARAWVDRVPFEPQDVVDLTRKLKTESETAQVLVFFSYLDDRIVSLMCRQLDNVESAKSQDRLFGPMGPLHTFSSRILLSRHLGWLSQERYISLDAFRKLRNEFAHRAFKIDSSDPKIIRLIESLRPNPYDALQHLVSDRVKSVEGLKGLLPKLVSMTIATFKDLLLLPAGRAFSVSPQSIYDPESNQPRIVSETVLALSDALIVAGGLEEKSP